MKPDQPTSQSNLQPRQLKRGWVLLLLAFVVIAGITYFFNLGGERTLSQHEGFAVIPAEQMLETGDWVVPMYGGLPRLKKPPLPYWMVAVSSTLWGKTSEANLTAARLPAAFSAVLLALLMAYWALRWYGRTAAIGVLFVQLTSLYAMIYGRKAEIDMFNFLIMTVAMFLIAEGSTSDSRKVYHLRWIAIFVLLSLSWLAKFHYGLVMVLAPCGLYYLVQKRYKELLNFAHPIGLLLLAAAVVIWPYLVSQRVPDAWNVWNKELVGRATGDLNKLTFPIWYYLPLLFWLTLPWTPLALRSVPHSWRRAWKKKDRKEQFLWIWILVQLAIVTIQPIKHKHYIISALPVFSLWTGQTIQCIVARVRDGDPLLNKQWACFWVILIVGSAITVGLLTTRTLEMIATPLLVISIVPPLFGLAALWLLYKRRFILGTGSVVVALAIINITTTGWLIPGRDHRLAAVYFMKEIRESLPEQENICLFRLGQDPIIYYLKKPAFRAEDSQRIQDQLKKQQRLYVITQKNHVDQLAKLGSVSILKNITTPPNCPRPRYSTHKNLILTELTTDHYHNQPAYAEKKKLPRPAQTAEKDQTSQQ